MRLRATVREITQTPLAFLPKALVLGFGIASATLGFGVVEALVMRPLPYHDPGKLVAIDEVDGLGRQRGGSIAALERWRARSEIFTGVAAYNLHDLNLTGIDRPTALMAASVTADFFHVLRKTASLGRVFSAEEAETGSAVVVLSHRFWMGRFGGSNEAIGSQIALAGRSHRIVGVLAKDFRFLEHLPDVFVPLPLKPSSGATALASNLQTIVARLQPTAGAEQAMQVMQREEHTLADHYPIGRSGWSTSIVSLHDKWMGRTHRPSIMMFWAAGILLLVACVNTVGLILAQSLRRRREVAIRLALGARWPDIAKDRLAEGLMLAAAAAMAGIVLAYAGFIAFRAVVPPEVALLLPDGASAFQVNTLVVAFTSLVAIFTAVACSVAPLAQDLGKPLAERLRGTGIFSVGAKGFRQMLVVGQVSLAIVLLVAGGLLLKGFWLAHQTPLGFDSRNLIMMWVGFEDQHFNSARRSLLYEKVSEDLAALPGVDSATVTDLLPTHDGQRLVPFSIMRQLPVQHEDQWPRAALRSIGDKYFSTLGIRLTDGRSFDSQDRSNTTPVVIVSASLARSRFAGNPIGQSLRIRMESDGALVSARIVGVAADVRVPLQSASTDVVYRPIRQASSTMVYFLARSKRPESVLTAARSSLWQIAPEQPMDGPWIMDSEIGQRLAIPRFSGSLVGGMAIGALFLACIGIYATMSHLVILQRREIGIRMAVGASAMSVSRLVYGRAFRSVLIGVAIGLLLASVASGSLQPFLLDVSRFDLAAYVAVFLLVLVVSAVATLLPAIRAARVDPNLVLRAD